MGDMIGWFLAAGGSEQCPDTLRGGVPGEKIRAPEGCACAPAHCSVRGAAQLCCPPGNNSYDLHSVCPYSCACSLLEAVTCGWPSKMLDANLEV